MPLTVCSLSNLKLCVVRDLRDHNLGRLLRAGACVTINADDPAYFGGYINENFTQTFAALGMTAQHAYRLARNSFTASFIDAPLRQCYLDRLNAVFADTGLSQRQPAA